ncbi:hypothetical protein M0R04_06055 [Candidatus Dojkabacteria bacterium]|jgi:hypothetical protein|nr:hypothetical protein [Candidatus Dojkabacteria bacterium]
MVKFKPDNRRKLKRWDILLWNGLNTAVSDGLTKRTELQFVENARSIIIGLLEKRAGYARIGNDIGATANYGLYNLVTEKSYLIRVSQVSGTISVYRYTGDSWVQLGGAATSLSAYECDFTTAMDRCFIVNGYNNNFYLDSNATNPVDSTSTTGMLYNSPKARLVNFFRDRIYLGDYLRVDGTRERTGICFSSPPLGIVALVSGDHTAPITTLNVTTTKYIKVGSANDSLDIYRGGTLIGTITVTGKTENSLTINAFGTDLKSSDEVWVAGTHDGEKVFRWDNRATGVNVRQYDSFKNTNEEDLTLLANVGNNQIIFTENSMTIWNGTYLKPLDLEVGCISKKTFVKILGNGIFLHRTGIYTTTGGTPKLLSAKLQPIFDNIDVESLRNHACAATDGTSYFCYLGPVTFYNKDGSIKKTSNSVIIEYHVQQNNFYIHTDVPMSHFVSYKTDVGHVLTFAKQGTPSPNLNDDLFITESITIQRTGP